MALKQCLNEACSPIPHGATVSMLAEVSSPCFLIIPSQLYTNDTASGQRGGVLILVHSGCRG